MRQAKEKAALYRVAMLLDALGWALMGGILLTLALMI